ncbi:hypothetical protein GGC63_006229 [Paenibacillus sp. OAS669]|nr:hypothetical protein [Paenibacillus sp. OAS669]
MLGFIAIVVRITSLMGIKQGVLLNNSILEEQRQPLEESKKKMFCPPSRRYNKIQDLVIGAMI